LVLPLIVIAAGGDLDIVLREVNALRQLPLPIAVYAQNGSGPIGPSGEVTPSGSVIVFDATRAAPTLTRWATISLSIVLALIAVWYLTLPRPRQRET